MSPRSALVQPDDRLTNRIDALSKRVSGAFLAAAADNNKNTFAAGCIQTIQTAFHKADHFAKTIPLPAGVTKHLSKSDVAFIVAAYAIPLPGTALFAAAIVGSKLGCRHVRNRWRRRSRD